MAFASLTSSQVVPTLLAQGPHSNHRPQTQSSLERQNHRPRSLRFQQEDSHATLGAVPESGALQISVRFEASPADSDAVGFHPMGESMQISVQGFSKCGLDQQSQHLGTNCSVAQSFATLCDPMDCITPGFPVLHISQSLLKLMSIESVMPSNHLILC